MPEILHTTLAFIVAIATLIAVHEYGHFIVARKLGVKVEKFSIGFGPALFSWRSRDREVLYVIAAIPLGGYVKMLGEQGDEATIETSERHRAFSAQPVWVRASIAAAGPLFNIAFALLAYMCIAWIGQTVVPPVVGAVYPASPARMAGIEPGDRIVSVAGDEVHSWRQLEAALKRGVGQRVELSIERDGLRIPVTVHVPPSSIDPLLIDVTDELVGVTPDVELVIDSVLPGRPAARAGIEAGDVVREVDGLPVNSAARFIRLIRQHKGKPVAIGLLRGDTMLRLSVLPGTDEHGQAKIGVRLTTRAHYTPETYRMGPFEGMAYGISRTVEMSVLTLEVIGKMLSASISAQNLGGPIAIAQLAGKTAELGLVSFLSFLALISVNLAVLNLLPVPVLDGGHLLYLAIEKVRGKPLSPRIMEWTQAVGVLMIAALMVFAFYNDLARLFKG
ncbi:MAG: RIP metalloprotease RseP [Zetaproteobacteria bacterium]|nr:MAG: RIP metalloprotease RseP [Zetaproteobacteria bacterium]